VIFAALELEGAPSHFRTSFYDWPIKRPRHTALSNDSSNADKRFAAHKSPYKCLKFAF
jgi:hypothetical protein